MRAIALLRGLNVGSNNRIKMPALVEVFERAGCREVTTYIQSGNVLFTASAAVLERVSRVVAETLAEDFEISSPVVLRTGPEFVAAVKSNPFLKRGVAAETLYVGFLGAQPSPELASALDPARSPPDAFELKGRELYLHLPNGVARSKLTNAYFDAKLKTVSTIRNWNTVLELARLAAE